MSHGQAVFLGHYFGAVASFWLWCCYQSEKRRKARRALERKTSEKEIYSNVSISNSGRKVNYEGV